MNVLLVAQYYSPESVGAAIWIRQLADDLAEAGHDVTVVTGFPNYPRRVVFPGYEGRWFMEERIGKVRVLRTFTYANPHGGLLSRGLNFAAFTLSAVVGVLRAKAPDVVYVILPPLPLGLTAALGARLRRAPLVANVQDIYPDIAIRLGILRRPWTIALWKRLERAVYRGAARVVVISDGFRDNLLRKGVPDGKVRVVPNWADADAVRPAGRRTRLREELGLGDRFVVLYAGGMTRNSNLEPLLDAAHALRDRDVAFVLAGDGVHKARLEALAKERGLENVAFLPFQPLERYPELLATGDLHVVTLHAAAAESSVPSKVFKSMASGRPILAIAPRESDLARLAEAHGVGRVVDDDGVADAVRWALDHPEALADMGARARRVLETTYDRGTCVAGIEVILREAARARRGREGGRPR